MGVLFILLALGGDTLTLTNGEIFVGEVIGRVDKHHIERAARAAGGHASQEGRHAHGVHIDRARATKRAHNLARVPARDRGSRRRSLDQLDARRSAAGGLETERA